MKKTISMFLVSAILSSSAFGQEAGEGKNKISVPVPVKAALAKKYPAAAKVTWEKEKGNYEANWGGKSGEDHSVQFTPAGNFIEEVNAISISELPAAVPLYVKAHYKGAKITEAGKVTDAAGKTSYEAEVKGKDIIFDMDGKFVKAEK